MKNYNESLGNLCAQNHNYIVSWWITYTKEEADNKKKKNPEYKIFCFSDEKCILSDDKPVKPYFPPKLRRCQRLEEVNSDYWVCCPEQEFDLLMLQRFLEKKKESWKLEEFKNYYSSLTKTERQEITQEIIKQEEMYSMVTRDFKIISQEEYNHLKMNWEIKEQTGIFMLIFFILLIFLKSFRKYFLKKG